MKKIEIFNLKYKWKDEKRINILFKSNFDIFGSSWWLV